MAQSTSTTTRDLNESRAEALSAILQSLSPNAAETRSNDDGKLSAEQVRSLSDKLGQILGDQPGTEDATRRNEKGALINDEGLPIIDINEPVTTADITFTPHPDGQFDDPDLLPVWTLSPAEKARRKAERERILDLLEEEERIQEQKDVQAARERYHQELEKRKEAAKTEIENLKRARDLQKKMGRALIRSVVESRDKEEKEKAALAEQDRLAAGNKAPKAKKSVSFADDIDDSGRIKPPKQERAADWGDVAPATLRSNGPEQHPQQPMKLRVVERHPRGLTQTAFQSMQDSDDESDPDSSIDAPEDPDSDNGFLSDRQPPQSEQSDEGVLVDEQISDWEGEDFDYAQHQREIALAYYDKRQSVAAEAASAMRAHTHGEDEWDQPDVPLEATLASAPPKSSVSRFKAERLAGAPSQSSLASHSLATSVIPSSASSSMKRAIRMGKLENGKLTGGEEGDSEDEVLANDERAQAMLELLKQGQLTNIGPTTQEAVSEIPDVPLPAANLPPEEPSPKHRESKASKFKLSLRKPDILPLSPSGSPSSVSTPTDVTNRSSPKLTTPPGGTPDGTTRSQQPRFTLPPEIKTAYQNGELQMQMPGMIIESPSFLASRPAATGQSSSPMSALSPTPTIVPTPTSASPTISPTVVSAAQQPAEMRTPTAPMRQAVVERRPPANAHVPDKAPPATDSLKPRVSRFKAQRS